MKNLANILFILLVSSCKNPKFNFDGYYLWVESESYNTININKGTVYSDGDKKNTSKKMTLFRYYNSKDSLVESFDVPHDYQILTGYIDSIFNNERYLLVSRKPYELICECFYDCKKKKSPNVKDTYNLCEDAVKRCKLHEYYIIVKDSNARYGPLTRQEFISHYDSFKIKRNNALQAIFRD